jgi:c-di-GMP-binding flagellar brake protein YcgR
MTLLATPRTPQRSASRSSFRVRRDARVDPRVPHRVSCRIQVAGSDAPPLTGRTVNLSKGGMSVQVPADLPRGARIEALVAGSLGTPVRVKGVVVHSRRVMADAYELGIQFLRTAKD